MEELILRKVVTEGSKDHILRAARLGAAWGDAANDGAVQASPSVVRYI
jgi:hypothetical protein